METPLIKLHTIENPDPTPTALTPEQLVEETNPEIEQGNE
jgi:hypothetical protein